MPQILLEEETREQHESTTAATAAKTIQEPLHPV